MKSSKEDLRKRGMVEETDVEVMINLHLNELLELVNSKVSVERSTAIRVLSIRGYTLHENIVKLLLDRLMIEKSLYTKIEICTALEKGDINVAEKMIDYIGKIGNNQYRYLPDKVSKKVSYPLPRDIIARSLGRMDRDILPKLLDILESNDEVKISEAIDSIGFLIFYSQELVSKEVLNKIISMMSLYAQNELILWKCTTCLSSLTLIETVSVLYRISESSSNEIIKKEADRSINIINNRINKIYLNKIGS